MYEGREEWENAGWRASSMRSRRTRKCERGRERSSEHCVDRKCARGSALPCYFQREETSIERLRK